MPPSDVEYRLGADMTVVNRSVNAKNSPEPEYKLTQFEEPFFLISLIRQIRQKLSEPKLTVPREYYRGESRLPITEMRAWYHELPDQIRFALRRPADEIGAFNFDQERKRLAIGAAFIFVGAAAGWFLRHGAGLFLGVLAGLVVGRGVAII